MRGDVTRLDRWIEAALSIGVVLSGALLTVGLAWPSQEALELGLVILMLTPVARVVVMALALLAERDWLFAALTLWILGVLSSSLRVARLL